MTNSRQRTFYIRDEVSRKFDETITNSGNVGMVTHGIKSLIVNRGIELVCDEYNKKAAKLKK